MNRFRTVSNRRAVKLQKLGVELWWEPGKGWTWDYDLDPRKCHHVARNGEHFFDWDDGCFMECDCGADPNDHGAYEDLQSKIDDHLVDMFEQEASYADDVYLSRDGLY